ncbi:MAG: hypothetical protein KGY99_02365 [Phycisphaerae bacterium]|jgi:hypothetical protein|nr:hypothetical protein [Phycisphaerae bacterium]
MTNQDPIVEQTREAGQRLWKQCDQDMRRFCQSLRESERKYQDRLIQRRPKRIAAQ